MDAEAAGGRLASMVPGAAAEVAFGAVTVDVAAEHWAAAATAARDELGADFFDWLSAHDTGPDAPDDEGLTVVAHVWCTHARYGLLLRTRLARSHGHLPTLSSVWPGANWHERETHEMFGVIFDGHPNLVPLLLPDGFEGHPLRKDFVLASRVAKPWPGAKEPGESDRDTGAPSRRRMLPPGVPGPGEWGPEAGAATP
jgi:NADH-quinone oxidoreductase subunit C